MRTLTLENDPLAVAVEFSADAFRVVLDDGRELSVPLAWFPRLLHATPEQRQACLLYTSPSPRDRTRSRMPSSA